MEYRLVVNYKTITIGTQIWMAENLKTTKYNNGTAIPLVFDETSWSELTTPGYSWYNNHYHAYGRVYGALYNWYAIDPGSNGGRNICPAGWHVHSDEKWIELAIYLSNTIYPYYLPCGTGIFKCVSRVKIMCE